MSMDVIPAKYKVWFRHSGEPAISQPWHDNETRLYTKEELINRIEGHTITHMIIDGDVPTHLNLLTPHLSHLAVKRIKCAETLVK